MGDRLRSNAASRSYILRGRMLMRHPHETGCCPKTAKKLERDLRLANSSRFDDTDGQTMTLGGCMYIHG